MIKSYRAIGPILGKSQLQFLVRQSQYLHGHMLRFALNGVQFGDHQLAGRRYRPGTGVYATIEGKKGGAIGPEIENGVFHRIHLHVFGAVVLRLKYLTHTIHIGNAIHTFVHLVSAVLAYGIYVGLCIQEEAVHVLVFQLIGMPYARQQFAFIVFAGCAGPKHYGEQIIGRKIKRI